VLPCYCAVSGPFLLEGSRVEAHRVCWSALVVAAAVVVVLIVALIIESADHVATQGAETGSDGGAFEPATALIANDAAGGGTAQGTDDGSGSGVGAVGAGDEGGRAQEGADKKNFHGLDLRCGVLQVPWGVIRLMEYGVGFHPILGDEGIG
jgi:hypothetical protein